MKAKLAGCLVLGFILGLLASFFWPGRSGPSRHWCAIREYNEYVRDPSNAKPDPQTGHYTMEPPVDPEPHLAALVAAGELNHLDIVLPTVPRSRGASRHWMAFCEAHCPQEIVYATGDPTSVAFRPAGTQPVHLNIWFKDCGQAAVQQLIKELEELGAATHPAPDPQ